MVCVPVSYEGCSAREHLVRLDDGTAIEQDARFATKAGGFYDHLVRGDLVRRRTLDGADELFTPDASLFAVDDRGVAWLEGDTLYTAPHGSDGSGERVLERRVSEREPERA